MKNTKKTPPAVKNVKTPAPVAPAPTAPVLKPAAKKTSKARENALKAPVAKAAPVVKKADKPAAATHREPSANGRAAALKAWVTIRANRAAAAKPAGKKAVAKG
jgi:hypothetical protein